MGTYSKIRHRVEIETFFKEINGERMEKSTKRIDNLGRGVQRTTTRMTKLDSQGKQIVTTTNKLTRGFQRFQMEQLGVMFGGMALNRAMNTLNATSREWLGIGELTSTMMGVTMLGANIDLLEYGVIPLFEALTNLPEGAQKAIGYVSFALEGLGATMMVGGQMMLGLDSTATLLAKIAGVRPELIFTEKGLTGLKNKLSGVIPMVGKLAKYAAAGILIGITLKDVSEEQYVAAVGGTAMAAGVIMGGKKGGAVFLIGAALKMVGDEDFLVDVIKVLYKVGEVISSVVKEAMWSAMTFRGFDIENIEGIADVQNAMDRAYEEITMERAGTGKLGIVAVPVTSLMAIQKKIEEENKRFSEGLETEYGRSEEALEEHLSNKTELEKESEKITQDWRDAVESEEKASNKRREDEADRFMESFIGKMTVSPPETLSEMGGGEAPTPWNILKNIFLPNNENNNIDIPKAVGGKIRNTGRYYLHEGEEVIPKSGVDSGKIVVNTTYHVNVSDKREFESLLRKNNQQLTSEVRRIVKV